MLVWNEWRRAGCIKEETGGTGVAEGFPKNVAEGVVFFAENNLTDDMKER